MGIVPSSYKEANVSPVPKKGDLTLVTNYRPISLLNSEAKIFERLIFKHPKAALLFWFFGDFRCGALLFMVIHVIYKYKNK